MSHLYSSPIFLSLALMAMGNWGNTPTPPDDPEAPPAVGNDGELTLENERLLIHSARLSRLDDHHVLQIEGEHVGGVPLFQLAFRLPDEVDPEAPQTAKGRSFALLLGEFQDSLGLPIAGSASSGHLIVTTVTGSGPWEIDGQLEISDDGESLSGPVQFRMRG